MSSSELEGVLPLDKPVGPSSHQMVALVRRDLQVARVGHTGTLDPFASGLLLLCLGRSTRLVEYLQAFPKEYLAVAKLGASTATDDPEGELVFESDGWRSLTSETISAELFRFEGTIYQRPPAFSAKKVGGRAAYELAREGHEVSLPPAKVTIHELHLERLDLPEVHFRVVCSTGTYVRGLARDLGERLGVGAHLTALRRLAIGPFATSGALRPEAVADHEAVEGALVTPLEALSHLPRVQVSREEALRLQSGQSVALKDDGSQPEKGEHAVAFGSHLLAVAVRDGREIRPRKVFTLE